MKQEEDSIREDIYKCSGCGKDIKEHVMAVYGCCDECYAEDVME